MNKKLSNNSNNKERLFLSPPAMSGREIEYIHQTFASNYIAPLGPMVDALEQAVSDFTGVQHCAALNSGTAALHLALILLGIKPGDEVICSSFTFSASANPIIYVGATPIFVDSEIDTWNMCPELLEKTIQSRLQLGRKPKAIILVHLYGMPANMDAIMKIADEYDIPVIEDAAEALGATYRNKPLGSFGCMGVFSFNGNKIITSSGGGALTSNDGDIIERARFLATQARDPAPHYQHTEIGYNYRMSNVVAAIGRGQMEVLPDYVKRCREINSQYRAGLEGISSISFLSEPDDRFYSNFWLSTITIDPNEFGVDREQIRLALEDENIESRPLWKPMHLQPVYSNYPVCGGGVSEKLFKHGLCLPSGVAMLQKDVERICGLVLKYFNKSNI